MRGEGVSCESDGRTVGVRGGRARGVGGGTWVQAAGEGEKV